jgi:hypothetical protein
MSAAVLCSFGTELQGTFLCRVFLLVAYLASHCDGAVLADAKRGVWECFHVVEKAW